MRKTLTIISVLAMVLVGFMAMANPVAACDGDGWIKKSVSDSNLWLGDYVTVTLEVYIPEGQTMTVEDWLPECLSYVGPFEVDELLVEPKVKKHVVSTQVTGTGSVIPITFEVIYDSAPAVSECVPNIAYLKDGEEIVDDACVWLWASKYCYFNKDAYLHTPTPDGNKDVNVGENVVWTFTITLHNNLGFTMEGIVIKDRFGAEIEVDDGPDTEQGSAKYTTKGKSQKVFLTWWDFDLDDGDDALLTMVISTDLNPAGKQEYTEPCTHTLNSGAVLKFKNPEGIQLSAQSGPSIDVKVYP